MRFKISICILFLFLIYESLLPADINITHYKIVAELIPSEHLLIAKTQIMLKNNSQALLKEIELYLSFEKIESVQDKNGDECKFEKIESGIKVFTELHSKDSIILTISYSGIFNGNVSNRIDPKNSWLLYESLYYPRVSKSFLAQDRFTFDLKVKVPDSLTVISSGRLVDTSSSLGKKIFYFKAILPLTNISISAAKYKITTFDYEGLKVSTYLYPEDDNLKDSLTNSFIKAFRYYVEKYGGYPYEDFKIVETERRGGYGAAGFILLNKSSIIDQKYRSQFLLYHELAHQWWANLVDPNKDGLLLSESLADYSVLDYWKSQGITNPVIIPALKIPIPLLDIQPDFTLNDYVRSFHFIYETSTIAEADIENGDQKYWAYHYKSVCFLKSLALIIGKDNMDKTLKEFVNRYKFQSASLADLIKIAEEMSGKNLSAFVNDWIYSKKIIDFKISDLTSEKLADSKYNTKITITNNGEIDQPIDVEFVTTSGKKETKVLNDFVNNKAVLETETNEEVVFAEVDPNWCTVDANRPDNIYPRRTKFSFLTAMPSLTENHYFYYPSITYGLTDGIRFGLWLTNDAPLFNIINRNLLPVEWRAGILYGIKSKRLGYHLDFTTSFGMPSHYWQWGALAENVRGAENYGINLNYIFAKDLNHFTLNQITFIASRYQVYDLSYYDLKDFSNGTNSSIGLCWQRIQSYRKENVNVEFGGRLINGNYSYSKVWAAYENLFEQMGMWFKVRLFAGIVRGNFPSQKSIFLSGSVMPDKPAFWFVDPDRRISTQENLHNTGDANLIGYIGQHLRGKNSFGVNLKIIYPRFKFVNLFVDAGNVWNNSFDMLRYDAGVGIDFKFIKIDFPFYINKPLSGKQNFDFRWLLELNFSL